MSKKYTIFDNFDKLDLSPIARNLIGEEAQGDSPEFYLEVLHSQNDAITYNTYNETNLTDLKNRPRPIAYSSDNMTTGVVPDMLRYITNNRFYISAGAKGEIYHTSKLKSLEDIIFISVKDSLLADNVFYDRFFFNIFLKEFSSIFSDALKLYNNPFYQPESSGPGSPKPNYIMSVENYFFPDDNYIDLKQFNPKQTGLLANKPIFSNFDSQTWSNPNNPFGSTLLVENLFSNTPQAESGETVFEYLLENHPKVYEQAVLFLHRLLFPVKTAPNGHPIHHYFVSDMAKGTPSFLTKYNPLIFPPAIESSEVNLEWQLPSIYAYSSFLNSTDEGKTKYYEDIVKFDSEVSLDKDMFSLGEYFGMSKKSKDHSDNLISLERINLQKHQTTIFGQTFFEDQKTIENIEHKFPIYNKIKLPAHKSDLLLGIKPMFRDFFIQSISNYFSSYDEFPGLFSWDKEMHTFSAQNRDSQKTNISLTDLQVLDTTNIHDNFWLNLTSPSNAYAFSVEYPPFFIPDYVFENEDFIKGTQNYLFKGIVSEDTAFSKTKKLSYKDVMNGEKCYSEVVMLEVVKYGVTNGEKTKLQSFFVPCLSEEQALTITDTQVFPDKEYIYEVFSISAVVGLEYRSALGLKNLDTIAMTGTRFEQTNLLEVKKSSEDVGNDIVEGQEKVRFSKLTGLDLNTYQLEQTSKGKLILIRAPYYNTPFLLDGEKPKAIVASAKPPMPPDISFTPYKDIDNKVLVSLQINSGRRRMIPKVVFPGDSEQIQKHFDSQKTMAFDNSPFDETLDSFLSPIKKLELEYETQTFSGTHKIWRTTQKPIGWGSFYSSVPVEINTEKAMAFEDDISPNVDYYYFARFEDERSNFSNPTDVFHVRMVREGGFPPYLIVKKYDFSEGRPPIVYEKGFKKYLKIRLADGTREYYNTDDVHKIDFGYKKKSSNDQLKKYKIRITSKKTGKKLDINIDFNKDISLFPSGPLQEIDLDFVKKQGMGMVQKQLIDGDTLPPPEE